MFDKLKAIGAALVSGALFFAKSKFGLDLGVEVETAIVGAVVGLIVYFIPNMKPEAPAVEAPKV
jgi:hypothetical protein